MPVDSLAALPFTGAEPLRLLGLEQDRETPDRDHAAYGFCRLPAVELRGEDQALWVEDPLVLALHSPDDDHIPVPVRAGVPRDINLEFVLDDGSSAVALLSEFLGARGAELAGDAKTIVLALCNPRRARISRPPALAGRRIYYGAGEVVAWLQRRPGATGWALGDDAHVQLAAERWYTC